MVFFSHCKAIVRILGLFLLLLGSLGAVGLWAAVYLPSRIPTTSPTLVAAIGQAIVPIAAVTIGVVLIAFSGRIADGLENLLINKSN